MRLAVCLLCLVALVAPAALDGEPPGPEAADFLATYTDSEACRACHSKEYSEWRESTHGLHSKARAEPPGGADGAVGSHWMQAYFRRDERGYHRIVDVCFDLRHREFVDVRKVLEIIRGLVPGLEHAPQTPLEDRSFDRDCAGCHSSQAHSLFDATTGRMATRWSSLDINCETCHGAGRAHVEGWTELRNVPLARLELLDARTSTAVCARCHGGPPTQGDFGPDDARHYVGLLIDREGMFPNGAASGQIYQHAQFVRSPCHRVGGLTCMGCHRAHGPGYKHSKQSDALCTSCHTGNYDTRAHHFHDPAQQGARCLECHMPRLLRGTLMTHQRDHTLGSPLPASSFVPDACSVCHEDKGKAWCDEAYRKWWGEPPRDTLDAIEAIHLARRGDARATPLLRRALRHPDPWFRANAARYLGDPEPILDDPLPEVRLVAVQTARNSGRAAEFLSRLAKDEEPVIRALAQAALIDLGQPAAPAMRPDFEIALRHHRDLPRARLALGVLDLAEKRPADAVLHFREMLAFAPGSDEALYGLASAYEALGRTDDAGAVHRRRARRLREQWRRRAWDVELVRRTASAFIKGGEPGEARSVLTRALREVPAGGPRQQVHGMLRQLEKTFGPVDGASSGAPR